MLNRKENRYLSECVKALVDQLNKSFDSFVNLSIKHEDIEKLESIRKTPIGVPFTEEQKKEQQRIVCKAYEGIAKIHKKQKSDADAVANPELYEPRMPFFSSIQPYLESITENRVAQATQTANESIDMLIESLGHEAEQATSRTVLEAIKYRANHIRPIHVDDDAIFKSQQTRIDRLIENVEQFIKNEIEIELEGIYSAQCSPYNDFQILVRKGIRILSGMEYGALDFMKFYDKGIDVRSTVESTIAKSEEYARMTDPLTSTEMQ